MSNTSESLPRFNRLKGRHELTLREARRGLPSFHHGGHLGALSIHGDIAIVSGPKTTTRVELEPLAGVVYRRSLAMPWFGLYRLTLVYLGDGKGRRGTASVVMG